MNNVIQTGFVNAFREYKNRTAIEYRDRSVSYGELDEKSGFVAGYLRNRGIGKGAHIALLANDKIKLITTMLGILRAGCVFVPLDNAYPIIRLNQMLKASDTRILISDNHITTEMLMKDQDGLEPLEMDLLLKPVSDKGGSPMALEYGSQDSLYIYFTSGTTGTPKGIVGQNKSLLHFIRWEIETFGVDENFRVSQLTSQCHDPFLRDIFTPLLAGGTICIPPNKETILSSAGLAEWLEKSRVNLIHCTPSLFSILNTRNITSGRFNQLQYILLAGEKVIPREIGAWYRVFGERIQLVNLYGPTETTLAKLFYLIKPADAARNNIPIGKPMNGCKVIIVDQNMKVCHSGEAGEILIRTPYRTLGYFNEPELNARKFIQNPFSADPGDMVFKTGDLGRVLPDGNIEFLGRLDRQIKIRGFRVELEEIETEIAKYPEINQCVVLYKEKFSGSNDEDWAKCLKCGLSSEYRGVTIDNQGTCNICAFYESNRAKIERYFKTPEDLKQLLSSHRADQTPNYDCLLLYSGGKDSTYVLYQLVEMGCKVLAYTFDNGYISKTTLANIHRIVKELNVDHIVDSDDRMKEVFLAGLKAENSVCNGCFKALIMRSNRLAWEKGIKHIITGFSRGQIFELKLYDIFQQGIFDMEEVERKIAEQRLIYHSREDYTAKILGPDAVAGQEILENVKLIDFYRYFNVTKAEILAYLEGKSSQWSNPMDTGFCSSNCLINDVGIYLQRETLGYDNYTFPTSWEIRIGHEQPKNAAAKNEGALDLNKINTIIKELGFDKELRETKNADGYLVAYLTARDGFNELDLTAYLEQRLPDYMMPAFLIKLESMPLSANGKLDYKQLPNPETYQRERYVAPRTKTERELEKIWREVLGFAQVSVTENFFRMGVHSLKIMNLIARIHEQFEVEFPLKEFFNTPSIEAVARYIEAAKNGN